MGHGGAVAGGAIGLAAGLFGEYEAAETEKKKQEVLDKAANLLHTTTADLQTKLDDYYKNNSSIGTAEDVKKYQNLISNYDPNEFVYEGEEFNNDYDVNDYYAPNKQAIIDKTANQIQGMAAGAGIGRGCS